MNLRLHGIFSTTIGPINLTLFLNIDAGNSYPPTLRGHINTSKERRKKSHHFLRRIPFLQNGLSDQHLYCCCCCCSEIKLSSQKHFSSTKHSICSNTKKSENSVVVVVVAVGMQEISFFLRNEKNPRGEREKVVYRRECDM